jgi:hypothetical protein
MFTMVAMTVAAPCRSVRPARQAGRAVLDGWDAQL